VHRFFERDGEHHDNECNEYDECDTVDELNAPDDASANHNSAC